MTTFFAIVFVAVFAYEVYRYLPERAERAFRLDRYHPATPLSDRTESYYEERRRYADLAAVYGRQDVPEQEFTESPRPDASAEESETPAVVSSVERAVPCANGTRKSSARTGSRRKTTSGKLSSDAAS